MKHYPKQRYARIRGDTGQRLRIRLMALFLGILAFVPVAVRLYGLMVVDYDYYARLALKNQTRSTQVTAHRGDIYDRNMNVLATSQGVENIYLDPHELKQSKADIPAISADLGEILNKDPEWIAQQAKDFSMRYKQIAAGAEEETAARVRDYIIENNGSPDQLYPLIKRILTETGVLTP